MAFGTEGWGCLGCQVQGLACFFCSFSLLLLTSLGQAIEAWAPQVGTFGPSSQELPRLEGCGSPGEALQPTLSVQRSSF